MFRTMAIFAVYSLIGLGFTISGCGKDKGSTTPVSDWDALSDRNKSDLKIRDIEP
jgi:hypothetical protein